MPVGVVGVAFCVRGAGDTNAGIEFLQRFVKTVFGDRSGEAAEKFLLQPWQFDPVLRTFWTGHARDNLAQIQLQLAGVSDLSFWRHTKEALSAVIVFVSPAMLFAASRGPKIIHAFLIDWEKTHRRAIFRRHIRDLRAIHH